MAVTGHIALLGPSLTTGMPQMDSLLYGKILGVVSVLKVMDATISMSKLKKHLCLSIVTEREERDAATTERSLSTFTARERGFPPGMESL